MTWKPDEDGRDWTEIVLEGEWDITQPRIQREIGPEYEMYKYGSAPAANG